MNQHILSRFAIFLLAIVLIVFGIEHFVHPRNMLIYVPTWIPGGLNLGLYCRCCLHSCRSIVHVKPNG